MKLIMVLYELKKVLNKRTSQILLVFMVLCVVWSCRSAIYSVEWINADGSIEVGRGAAKKLQTAQQEWAGTLDESMLRKALDEVKRLDAMPEALSKNFMENRIAQSRQQGIQEIRTLLNLSFAEGFQNYNDRIASMVSSEALPDFYPNRINTLKDWLYGKDEENLYVESLYSETEKQFLINRYSALGTPFIIEYSQGWVQVMRYASTVLQLGMILLGLLLAGIFSDEFQWKTDTVYFSSVHGRGKGTTAKLITGFLLITVVFLLSMGTYSLIVLGSLGFGGGSCPIQVQMRYWKSMYNLTFRQAYILILCMGYAGELFFGFLVMLISSKMRSPHLAVMIPPLAILLPNFLKVILQNIDSAFVGKLLGLLPNQMLNGTMVLSMLDVYSFGNKVLTPISLMLPLYTLFFLLLAYLCYREAKRKQIT